MPRPIVNLTDGAYEEAIRPIWRLAFRPFFLAGALFAIVAMLVWAGVLSGVVSLNFYGGAHFWHAHEMLFGFVAAVVVGFLLTAVQTWTGLRSVHGSALQLLAGSWLVARLMMLFGNGLPAFLILTVDMAFYLLSALFMARLVIKSGNVRNLFFVPVLVMLGASNGVTHLSVLRADPSYFQWGSHATVMLITCVMSVVGGRVIPMFTANGTHTPRVYNLPWLEYASLGTTWCVALLYVTQSVHLIPHTLLAGLFFVASATHVFRALRWRPQVTLGVPLVWSLHLVYWFIPVGLMLFGIHYLWGQSSVSQALHALTAGAMGSLILAMMSRVSLGHTGRPLKVSALTAVSLGTVAFGGVIRLLSHFLEPKLQLYGYLLAIACWVLAFSIFLVNYWRVLLSPRADGRPG